MRWNCMPKRFVFYSLRLNIKIFLFFFCISNDKNFIPKYPDNALTYSVLTSRASRRLLEEKASENDFIVRNNAASIIGNGVISLLWQLRCHCNPDHDKFSSLPNTTVVAIFPNVCWWRRSLCVLKRGFQWRGKGGHQGWRHCGIELFFKRYLVSIILILMCRIVVSSALRYAVFHPYG